VKACEPFDAGLVELYFYGDLDAPERARVDAHLAGCVACRRQLDDLGALRDALARVPRPDAPPAGDWSGFMHRLDRACSVPVAPAPHSRSFRWARALALAAMIAVIATGIYMAARVRGTIAKPAAPPATMTADASAQRPASLPDRSLLEQSEEHLERSKLVVLGLATRDAHQTKPADWEYERELAGSLLPDTRLFRIAAQKRGLTGVAGTMGDLETVLLEASLSDQRDPDALARVQQLIRKRDLLVKMQVVQAAGI